jgi:phosphoglycolate phosphatase
MAHLLLRGQLLADASGNPHRIEAVLFDKDGTLSISEPMLHALASARVFHARQLLQQRHPELPASETDTLADLLQRAYGLKEQAIHPAGATAVGSRAHNLLSTATALAQVGLGWPEALELSEAIFAATDGLHGQGSQQRPIATEGLHELVEALNAAGAQLPFSRLLERRPQPPQTGPSRGARPLLRARGARGALRPDRRCQ